VLVELTPTALAVRAWLSRIANRLHVADPAMPLGPVLDATFDRPPGDPGYPANELAPGAAPLELSFSEREPAALRLDAELFGPRRSPAHRRERTVATVSAIARRAFDAANADRFESAVRPWLRSTPSRFGAFFGAALDASGLVEATVYLELPRDDVSMLPETGGAPFGAVREVISAGVRPLMHAVSVSRAGVTERLSLICLESLPLLQLERLLASASLADRFHALLDDARPLTGRRLVVPPGGAILGLRKQPDGLEIKLELLVANWPVDALGAVTRLLAARPASSGAFLRWRRALAGAAYPGPVNVVSVRLGPRYGPQINVYIRPLELARICGIRGGSRPKTTAGARASARYDARTTSSAAVNAKHQSERAGEGETMAKKVTKKTAANRNHRAEKKPAKLKTLPPKTVDSKKAKAVKGGAESVKAGPWGGTAPTITSRTLSASTLNTSADRSVSPG
jgi:hypothetical protein